ncbi:unnamed protein product [Meloidogyne enterolobii]|uniref:Uncharacterized protein n=1 Tax=Meloidogyne enterolobii TaxID=390850 RepID=A0ACB1AVL2_MELEN
MTSYPITLCFSLKIRWLASAYSTTFTNSYFSLLGARHQQLVYESKVYSLLSAGVGIPRVQYSGVENNYNCIVMDLLGHSLEDLFNICQRRFSLKVLFFEKKQLIGGGGRQLVVQIRIFGRDDLSHLEYFNEAMPSGRDFGAINRLNVSF